MSLPTLSIRRPVTTLMFFLGVVFLGIIAFQNLAVDFLPSVQIPRLAVQTTYADVSPEELENTVTQPIEAGLLTVTGAKKVSSVSREGLSVVTVEFHWGTNMDFAMLEVREKLDQLRAALPREAGRPTILKVDPTTEPIMTIAVSEAREKAPEPHPLTPARSLEESNAGNALAPTFSGPRSMQAGVELHRLVELKEVARALIKRRIEQVNGVAQASVLGGLEREIVVEIDRRKLEALGLSIDQVSQALASANLNLPGGTIKRGLFRYSLRTVGEFTRVDEIRHVPVHQTSAGRVIRISDLGSVQDTFRERIGITRYNGEEIIAIHVRKEAGSNTVEVSRRVHGVLEQLRQEYPNLRVDVIADQAEFISKSITDVKSAIVIGAVLAFLVLFFFLRNVKYPIIIGLTMPISILATFVAMYFLGINLNVISLTGLALGIGMLGDNATIVIENVTRLREKGLGILEAAVQGAQEITLAVTTATLTNVAIFLPIIFVRGVAQQLFVDMGVTMTISLLVSLLVAATLVPMLLSRETSLVLRPFSVEQHLKLPTAAQRGLFRWIWILFTYPIRLILATLLALLITAAASLVTLLQKISPGFYGVVDKLSSAGYKGLEGFLSWALNRRGLVIGATLGVFAAAVWISTLIPSEPAPDIDQSRFRVEVHMPKGATLESTSRLIHTLERDFLQLPGVMGVYSGIGITEERAPLALLGASMEKADLEIKVKQEALTGEVIESVRTYLAGIQPSLGGVEFSVKRRGTTFEQILRPEPNDVKIRVTGPDLQIAHQVGEKFLDRLIGIKGLVDVRSSMQKGSPQYEIVVDREKASRHGLSVRRVAEEIVQQVRGKEATYLSDFDRKITIRVQLTPEQKKDIENILSSTIRAGSSSIPVRELVQWQRTEGHAEIWRENSQRVALIAANVSGRSVGGVVRDIEDAAAKFPLPSSYRISVGGEREEIQESFRSLLIIILLSIFLVYMILAAEYESILYPFVILLTSPLAFIGAILAMALTGQNYNVMSIIGLVIMIGAVDNDAVIAVDIITAFRRQGIGLIEAVKEGMKRRLRPILMTTATTVLGIIPLTFEFGAGSELVRALTAPLVGGLLASTLFTIVAIPVVYTYVDLWAVGRKQKTTR